MTGLSKTIDPSSDLLIESVKAIFSLANSLWANAEELKESEAADHPELWMLTLFKKAGTKHPILLLDSYEHLLKIHSNIKTRLHFADDRVQEGSEHDMPLPTWLAKVFQYLAANGWLIVVAGRQIPKSDEKDMLEKFSHEELIEAIKNHPELKNHLAKQQSAMVSILTNLSFGGNPLWLQVAMNLLVELIKEGRDLSELAQRPDIAHAIFEEEDLCDPDIDFYEGIEFARRKLSLLGKLSNHITGMEEQAWKIALPWTFDNATLKIIFPEAQAKAIMQAYNTAGVFRKVGTRFALHEEIRDLLLAWARSKGWLNSDTSREIHHKLWLHLNQMRATSLPEELEEQFTRDGLGEVLINRETNAAFTKSVEQHFPAHLLLEAVHHRVLSLAEIPGSKNTPESFWTQLGGSVSLSSMEKWCVAEHLPDLLPWQTTGLEKVFSDELNDYSDLFSPRIAQALRQALLSGRDNPLTDLNFWEDRIHRYGQVDDYHGYQLILSEHFSETHTEKFFEITKQMLYQYGDQSDTNTRRYCAEAMFKKSITHGQMGDNDKAIATYDQLIDTYRADTAPAIREKVANAMGNKGYRHGQMGDNDKAIATYDQLIDTYRADTAPAIRELVANAMGNKGYRHGQMGDNDKAIATYDQLIDTYRADTAPAIREQVARAMNGRGFNFLMMAKQALAKHNKSEANELLHKAKTDLQEAIKPKPLWGMALGNLAYTLWLLEQPEEAETTFRAALNGEENAGESLYQGTLDDIAQHTVPEDAGFREMVERLWAEYQAQKPDKN